MLTRHWLGRWHALDRAGLFSAVPAKPGLDHNRRRLLSHERLFFQLRSKRR
jgi:hypothetical protein